MTAIASHLRAADLEARYETAADPVSKSHFHAIWLLSSGYTITEVAAILSFSVRWVRLLPSATTNTDRTALAPGGRAVAQHLRSSRQKRFLCSKNGSRRRPMRAAFGRAKGCALACQLPRSQIRARSARLGCADRHRIFHPKTEAAPSQNCRRGGSRRAKKNCKTPPLKKNKNIRTPPSRSGRWTSIGSA